VSSVAAADFEPDKDPPPAIGKRERYTPRSERVVLAISADANAPLLSEPQDIRIVARPLVDGRLGEILATKTIPIMVLQKP
jgi:hypothetical protein